MLNLVRLWRHEPMNPVLKAGRLLLGLPCRQVDEGAGAVEGGFVQHLAFEVDGLDQHRVLHQAHSHESRDALSELRDVELTSRANFAARAGDEIVGHAVVRSLVLQIVFVAAEIGVDAGLVESGFEVASDERRIFSALAGCVHGVVTDDNAPLGFGGSQCVFEPLQLCRRILLAHRAFVFVARPVLIFERAVKVIFYTRYFKPTKIIRQTQQYIPFNTKTVFDSA